MLSYLCLSKVYLCYIHKEKVDTPLLFKDEIYKILFAMINCVIVRIANDSVLLCND